MSDTLYLIAVHGGAGAHAASNDTQVKKALKEACIRAVDSLKNGAPSLQAVEDAITVLEDDACLNAGYGSNLTLDGTVECDASIMDGKASDFGGVGAVFGLKNPVRAARAVLEHSRKPDPLGRIPPLLLVSEGAAKFAKSQSLEIVSSESLVSPRAKQEWAKWKETLESSTAAQPQEGSVPSTGGDGPASVEAALTASGQVDCMLDGVDLLHAIQDTVGAVALDSDGSISAGVSSGGLLLKQSGRVGEAAVYGAGCWAKDHHDGEESPGIACSVSGAGEPIIRTMLAKTLGDAVAVAAGDDTHSVIERVVVSEFCEVCKMQDERVPQAGVLLLVKEQDDAGKVVPRVWCAFTTESMAVAYASSLDPKPRALILRHEHRRLPHPQTHTGPPIYITALPLTRA